MAKRSYDSAQLQTIPRGQDLDGYVFTDLGHARQWLSQGFVDDESYAVIPVSVLKKKCRCGNTYDHATPKGPAVPPSEFLKSVSA